MLKIGSENWKKVEVKTLANNYMIA